jgi:NADH-quinone oxidoreductase subunit A
MPEAADSPNLFALGLYIVATFGMAAFMVASAYVLGTRKRGRANPNPFESGILPTRDTHVRFPIQFSIIAILFVIFDLDMVFVFAWEVAARPAGWLGYGGLVTFLALLLVALAYLWRGGALEWGRPRARTGSVRQ